MPKLSGKQYSIYHYIANYIRSNGVSPSIREIGDAFSLKSTSTVFMHLKKLQYAGLIDTGTGKKRCITLAADPRAEGIPILGTVRAGQPLLAFEDIEGRLPFSLPDRDEYFALRIQGDSMEGAGMLAGDCVIVHRQAFADHGDIVVALLGEEATVKRLCLRDGRVLLMPENPRYEPIPGDDCTILGKVTSLVRNY